MTITKHQADDRGSIQINNCVRLLTMGLQGNVVTIWAVTDILTKQGLNLRFMVKKDGDLMTVGDCQRYVTSFISNEGEGVWHLVGEEQKIVPASMMPNPPRPGGTHNPGGKIIT